MWAAFRCCANKSTSPKASVLCLWPSRPKDHPRNAALHGTDATALIAPNATDGMGVTMRETVKQLPDCDAFMVLLGDLVSIENNDLQSIVDAMDTHPDNLIWRGATTVGKPGHPIIFDKSVRPAFDTLQGDDGGDLIVKPLRDKTHLHRFQDDRARYDLDTPEDWAEWRAGLDQ